MLKSQDGLMPDKSTPANTTINVFTRHSPTCPKKGDPQWKRSKSLKILYFNENGKHRLKSAKDRFSNQAGGTPVGAESTKSCSENMYRIAKQQAARKAGTPAYPMLRLDRPLNVSNTMIEWIFSTPLIQCRSSQMSLRYSFRLLVTTWRIKSQSPATM